MRLLFTTIIFLFLLSAYAQKDSLVFIKAADLKSDSEILTSRDSIMLDSVYNLFKQLDVLENTINSLEDSLYSDYLVNLLCEKYAQKIEKDFEIRLDFIAKNIFKHNFIYGELDPITMERTKILNNPFFLEVLSLYMIENGFLDNYSLFDVYYSNNFMFFTNIGRKMNIRRYQFKIMHK